MKTRTCKSLFVVLLLAAFFVAFADAVSAQDGATPGAEIAATVEGDVTPETDVDDDVTIESPSEVAPIETSEEVTTAEVTLATDEFNEIEATPSTAPPADATTPEPNVTDDPVEAQGVNRGTVSVRAIDTNGDKVIGEVCIQEFLDAGGGTPGTPGSSVCDTPGSFPEGLLFAPNRDPDDYVIAVTTTPSGYTAPANAIYSVTANNETIVNLVFQITGTIESGSIQVTKVDAADTSIVLTGACFAVFKSDDGDPGDTLVLGVCDADDGTSDGLILIEDVQAGDVILSEVVAPDEYEAGDPIELTVVTGQQTDVTVGNTFVGAKGSFTLTAEDDNGDPVEGACFEVYESAGGTALGELTSGGDDLCSDASGFVLNAAHNPGDIVIVNVVAPPGFGTPGDQVFTIVSDQETKIAIVLPEVDENTPGSIRIFKQDPFRDPLAGTCFKVFVDDDGERGSSLTDEVCDEDDGTADGRIDIAMVAPGDVLLAETVAPDDFKLLDDIEVRVNPGQRTTITVLNQLRPEQSFFVLSAEDENGSPVEGACFEVYEDAGGGALGDLLVGGTGLCSDENGFVLSRNEEPCEFVVVVVTTPE